jgi:hypothetical protein
MQDIFSDKIAFSGWDNSSSVSSAGTGIHHPEASMMKISFDNQALTTNSMGIIWSDGSYSPSNTLWNVAFDSGMIEHGSSGSPLFNTAQRVIGQAYRAITECPPNGIGRYGRLDKSWTGGGTSATGLINWLAPSTSATTTDLIRFAISGPSLVPCSGTVTYSLPARATSYSVTWNVGSLQIISGQGTRTITVQKSSSSTVANAVITATVTYTGGSSVLTKSVDIGSPHITSLSGPSSVKVGSSAIFTAQPLFLASEGEYQWTVTPNTATMTPYRQTCGITFNASGGYLVGVRSTSTCTTPGSYTTTTVSVSSSYLVSSGTGKQVSVALAYGAGVTMTPSTIAWSLHNQITGTLAANGHIAVQGGTLDFGSLPNGIYVLSLDTEAGNPDTHKIVLK